MEIQQVQILVCVLLDNWHRFVEKQRMVERVSYDSTMKGPTMNFLSEWRNNRSNSPRIQGMIAHVLSNLVFLAAICFSFYINILTLTLTVKYFHILLKFKTIKYIQ